MKIQLIDSRPGVMKSVVLKEWMRIALSICLLGLPVILGYFSIQIVEARNTEIAKDAPALGGEFELSRTTGIVSGKSRNSQALPASHPVLESPRAATTSLQTNPALEIAGGPQYPRQIQHKKNLAEHQAPTMYADYGDMVTTAQPAIGSANIHIPKSELFRGFTIHKTGRLIDPASYIHSTIR